jgi:hypothetical protein
MTQSGRTDSVNWHALTPLFAGITLSAVAGICARHHHQSTEDADTFNVSPAAGYLMIGCGLLFCLVPWILPGAAGNISNISFFWHFSPFWCGAFIASIYCFRYQVTVKDQSLTYGAFVRKTIPFSSVIDSDVIQGSRRQEVWIYLRDGRRLKFSSMLGDFDEFAGLVNSHMAIPPHGQVDSQAKIADRARRSLDSRRANQLMVAGLAIVGIVVFVLWKLRLTHF